MTDNIECSKLLPPAALILYVELIVEPSLSSLIKAAESRGGPDADALFSALYKELRRLANRELARQGSQWNDPTIRSEKKPEPYGSGFSGWQVRPDKI